MRDLKAALSEYHVSAIDPIKTYSDIAYLTASGNVADWVKWLASAICRLHSLDDAARTFAKYGVEEGDPPFDLWPHWRELRQALVEVALWLVTFERDGEQKAADRTLQHARSLARYKQKFSGRKPQSYPSHTEYLRDMIAAHPGMDSEQLMKKILNDPESLWEKYDSGVYFKDPNSAPKNAREKPYDLKTAIENARKPSRNKPPKARANRSNSAI